jgi:hypothetical protein
MNRGEYDLFRVPLGVTGQPMPNGPFPFYLVYNSSQTAPMREPRSSLTHAIIRVVTGCITGVKTLERAGKSMCRGPLSGLPSDHLLLPQTG